MNDDTQNKIHQLLREEGGKLEQVYTTLETSTRGMVFVAKITFRPSSQGQMPLIHNIFEQVKLFIYHDEDWDLDTTILPTLLRELRDAYLLTERSEFGRTGYILGTMVAPELRQSALSLSVWLDSGSIYCDGFRDWHDLLIDGVIVPHALWDEVLSPITIQHGLFLLIASLSAQEQLFQAVR